MIHESILFVATNPVTFAFGWVIGCGVVCLNLALRPTPLQQRNENVAMATVIYLALLLVLPIVLLLASNYAWALTVYP